MFLLDTNTISYILKDRSLNTRVRFAAAQLRKQVAISVLTEAELLYGLAKQGSEKRSQSIAFLLSRISIVDWDRTHAKSYGSLRAQTEARGMTVATLDLLIAAQAHAMHATLVTSDRALLRLSPYLQLENWATDLQ